MKFKLLDKEQQKEARCYFCGTDKNVKYEVRIFDNDSIEDINERHCCNKCICMFIDNAESKNKITVICDIDYGQRTLDFSRCITPYCGAWCESKHTKE